MKTTVSVRWQTVIPRQVREELGIQPNSQLEWQVKDGAMVVYPIPADPVRASVGMWKGRGPTNEDLLASRRADRELERRKERRLRGE